MKKGDNGTLGLIGYGNMGSAIVDGLVGAGLYDAEHITVFDTDADRCDRAGRAGYTVTDSAAAAAAASDTVIVAVKPGLVGDVLGQLAGIGAGTLLISIAAGVTLADMEARLPGRPVIRVMPNTPCLAGEAASALTRGSHATYDHAARALRIMGALGYVTEVPEKLMDAVTGLSGSGPAYVALMMDALADGGVRAGLPRPVALRLAVQTVLGAAKLVRDMDITPSTLRDMVTSPGGTTIEGVSVLEANAFRSAVIEAVTAAAERSRELGG